MWVFEFWASDILLLYTIYNIDTVILLTLTDLVNSVRLGWPKPILEPFSELLIKWLHLFLITYSLHSLHLQLILTCREEVSRLLSEACYRAYVGRRKWWRQEALLQQSAHDQTHSTTTYNISPRFTNTCLLWMSPFLINGIHSLTPKIIHTIEHIFV